MPKEPRPASPAPARIRDRATWLISRSHARSYRLLSEGFAAEGSGLRGYHYRVLAALEEWGPIGQADLGRRTGLDRSDVVNILGDLERLGLTERTVDPTNRRRNIVAITPAGQARLQALVPRRRTRSRLRGPRRAGRARGLPPGLLRRVRARPRRAQR